MSIGLAFKIFWRTLFNQETAEGVRHLLEGEQPKIAVEEKNLAPLPKQPVRSEALTLLSTLQREARLIDFLKEGLDGYEDAQVGAAVRDIHRDSAAVLERLYAIRPASETAEGESTSLEKGFSSTRYRLVGNVSGEGPFSGTVTHQGWEATKSETPTWQGDEGDANVLAPVEVEVK